MYQIVLYFLHSTSVLSFYIDVVLTFSTGNYDKNHQMWKMQDKSVSVLTGMFIWLSVESFVERVRIPSIENRSTQYLSLFKGCLRGENEIKQTKFLQWQDISTDTINTYRGQVVNPWSQTPWGQHVTKTETPLQNNPVDYSDIIMTSNERHGIASYRLVDIYSITCST